MSSDKKHHDPEYPIQHKNECYGDYLKRYDDYLKRSYNYYPPDNSPFNYDDYRKSRQSKYTPSTSSSNSESTAPESNTYQLNTDHPVFIFACVCVAIAAISNIVWIAIPTAENIYSRFPSAEAFESFGVCTLEMIFFFLVAIVLLTVITRVLGLFMRALRAI